jgi:hypothetical protein
MGADDTRADAGADASALRDVLDGIGRFCPQTRSALLAWLDRPADELIAEHWRHFEAPRSAHAHQARALFDAELVRTLRHQGMPAPEADRVAGTFRRCPVYQTGPHSELLLDPVAFHALLLTGRGAQQAGLDVILFYACGQITLETRAGVGPGWISLGADRVNVFGLSRGALARTGVCGLVEPVTYRLELPAEPRGAQLVARLPYLARLRELLVGRTFEGADAAFRGANALLWGDWGADRMAKLVVINDDFFRRLVAAHLRTPTLLRTLLFCPDRLARMEAAAERVHARYGGAFSSDATDLFWALRDRRLRPLRLLDGALREHEISGRPRAGADSVTVPFRPDVVADGLEAGTLFPNLLVIYGAGSILSRDRVLGGLRMVGYYPQFHEVYLESLDPGSSEEQALAEDLRSERAYRWCMAVHGASEHPLERLSAQPAPDAAALIAADAARSLRELTGGLRGFRRHPEWSAIFAAPR